MLEDHGELQKPEVRNVVHIAVLNSIFTRGFFN